MTYSAAFQRAVALTLSHEGGYQSRHDDPGNWTGGKVGQGLLRGTNMGIAAHRYPGEDIAGMTRARAEALYHRDYWLKVRGDELPPGLALITFDMAVNAGPGAAVKCLQRACKVADDGVLGPATLAAAHQLGDAPKSLARLSRRRIRYYAALKGWAIEWQADAWTQRTMDSLLAAAGVHV